MDVLVERCAGLDVHRDTVVATVRVPSTRRGQRHQETRTFATTVRQLEALGDWLATFGVTLVGMEATGVYWKPVFAVLEQRFGCWLLNAQHLHNVPGRKTDVADSAWICQLLEHGLVRPSFVPPQEVRDLRELTRLRKAQVEERTRTIQRVEKVLQDSGIKLTSVASQVYSKSARAMLEALVAGTTDPHELAELAKGRLRSKRPRLVEALANRFRVEHHGVLVAGLLAHIDSLENAIAGLDARVAEGLAPVAKPGRTGVHHPWRLRSDRAGAAGRVRLGHECVCDLGQPGFVGRDLSGEQRLWWQTEERADPTRAEVATPGSDRGRPLRGTNQGNLPCCTPCPGSWPSRTGQGDRCHPPRHPGRVLLHRPRPGAIPGARTRLGGTALLGRAPHQSPPPTAGSPRNERHRPTRHLRVLPDGRGRCGASTRSPLSCPRGIHISPRGIHISASLFFAQEASDTNVKRSS